MIAKINVARVLDRAITNVLQQQQPSALSTTQDVPMTAPDETCPMSGVRLLPLTDWQYWQPRFYSWLRAWVARIDAKTCKLLAVTERRERLMHSGGVSATSMEVSPCKTSACDPPKVEPDKDIEGSASLPVDFISGTIVEVNFVW